jgi:hypothetical protein
MWCGSDAFTAAQNMGPLTSDSHRRTVPGLAGEALKESKDDDW